MSQTHFSGAGAAIVESLETRQLLASITGFGYSNKNGLLVKLKDNATIDLAAVHSNHLTITAKTSGNSIHGVLFSDGHKDKTRPYTDTMTGLGGHVVTAYALDKHGKKLKSSGKFVTKKIHFTLIDSRVSNAAAIDGVVVIDEQTGDPLVSITEGSTLEPFSLPTTDIGIGAACNSQTQSVSFNLDGTTKFDSSSPFSTADLDLLLITPGDHTLIVTPFNGTTAGTAKTIHFKTAAPAPAGPQVSSLDLVDAGTDTVIRALTQNDTIKPSEIPAAGAKIRANILGTVGVVQFHLDTSQSLNLDFSAPYEEGGTGSDYLAVGTHHLTVKAFSGSSTSSGGGDPFNFDYTVSATG